MDVVDYVRELTEIHTHREHFTIRKGKTWYGQHHTTIVPALLRQLITASPSGNVQERDNTGYGSRPTARLEALDTLMEIDAQAARWVRWLGHDDPGDLLKVVRRIPPPLGPTCPECLHDSCTTIRLGEYVERRPIPGSGTFACVRLLGGLHPNQDKRVQAELARDMRRWWTWARIVSGWDSPAWRPDNTCPMCGERRTLRINLAAQAAFCVHETCHETWDETRIGLLAEHIRQESDQERPPPAQPIPCQCRYPLQQQGRWGLCPICGSSVCLNAEAVAEREEQARARARDKARLEKLERIATDYQRRQQRRRAG